MNDMTSEQQRKLDLIGKILSVAEANTRESKAMAESWDAQLGFIRRTAEVLAVDASAKYSTEQQLRDIAEDVCAGKL